MALNESWDVNYGEGGVQNGPNIPFTVRRTSTVTFTWDQHYPCPIRAGGSTGPSQDNNIWWDGVRHDSRDLLYRTPGGAVPVGTPVTLRLRTYHNDVTDVKLRLYDLNAGAQQILPMMKVAEDVDCYQTWFSPSPAISGQSPCTTRMPITSGTALSSPMAAIPIITPITPPPWMAGWAASPMMWWITAMP